MQALAGHGHGHSIGCARRDGSRAVQHLGLNAMNSGLSRRSSAQHRQPFRQQISTVTRFSAPGRSSFAFSLLGPGWINRAPLHADMLNSLMELPGTLGMYELRLRADALTTWKMSLLRGTLPKLPSLQWPQEPLRSMFADIIRREDLLRLTRRYPVVADTLVRQLLAVALGFEEQWEAAEEERRRQEEEQQQQQAGGGGETHMELNKTQMKQLQKLIKQAMTIQGKQQQQGQGQGGAQVQIKIGQQGQQGQAQGQQGQGQGPAAVGGSGSDPQQQQQQQQGETVQMGMNGQQLQQLQELVQEAMSKKPRKGSTQVQIKIQLQSGSGNAQQQQQQGGGDMDSRMRAVAESLMKEFAKELEAVMQNLEAGEMAFDDLTSLLEGPRGFDLSQGTWASTGWRELNKLREVLEKVPELRELVRQLGRSGGKGPLRRAPEELEARGYPPGVIRSPLQPEEVRGLTRSGELSRMLPAEMALLAHGWPRKKKPAGATAGGGGGGGGAQAAAGAGPAAAGVVSGAKAAPLGAAGGDHSAGAGAVAAAGTAAGAAEAGPVAGAGLKLQGGGSGRRRSSFSASPANAGGQGKGGTGYELESHEVETVAGGLLRDFEKEMGEVMGSLRAGKSPASSPTTTASNRGADVRDGAAPVSSGEYDKEEYYLPGAHAARLLHRVRRAERMLLSYERTGWMDDQPARVTSRLEIRPAAELGPILLCLDTSGSMSGAPEVVAKALTLECMRVAHRQKRKCYLYAFSGPRQVEELELRHDAESLDALLTFLSSSFCGGTDVDEPLQRAMDRLAQADWSQADILMVTDGQIADPDDKIVEAIDRARKEKGLKVHGLLVSPGESEAMKRLCSKLHVFKSWTDVPGADGNYVFA